MGNCSLRELHDRVPHFKGEFHRDERGDFSALGRNRARTSFMGVNKGIPLFKMFNGICNSIKFHCERTENNLSSCISMFQCLALLIVLILL